MDCFLKNTKISAHAIGISCMLITMQCKLAKRYSYQSFYNMGVFTMTGGITIVVYKSDRKNAKSEMLHYYVYDCVDGERARRKILEICDDILNRKNELHANEIRLSAMLSFATKYAGYKNVDGNFYIDDKNMISIKIEKHSIFSIEQLINEIYRYYMVINPNNTLHPKTLHNAASPTINWWNEFYK